MTTRYSTPGNSPSDFYGGSRQQRTQQNAPASYFGSGGSTPGYQNFGNYGNNPSGMGAGSAGMSYGDGPSGFMSGMNGTWQEPGYSNQFTWGSTGGSMAGLGGIGGGASGPDYMSPDYYSQMMSAGYDGPGGTPDVGMGTNQMPGGGAQQASYRVQNGQVSQDPYAAFRTPQERIAQNNYANTMMNQQNDPAQQAWQNMLNQEGPGSPLLAGGTPGVASGQPTQQQIGAMPTRSLQDIGTPPAQMELANRGASGNAVAVGNQQAPNNVFSPDPALAVDVDQMGQDILSQMQSGFQPNAGNGMWGFNPGAGPTTQSPGVPTPYTHNANRGPTNMGGMSGFAPNLPGSTPIPSGQMNIGGVPYSVNTAGQSGYGGGGNPGLSTDTVAGSNIPDTGPALREWMNQNGIPFPNTGGGQQKPSPPSQPWQPSPGANPIIGQQPHSAFGEYGNQNPAGSMAIGPDGRPYGGTPNLYPPQGQAGNGPFGFAGGGWGDDMRVEPGYSYNNATGQVTPSGSPTAPRQMDYGPGQTPYNPNAQRDYWTNRVAELQQQSQATQQPAAAGNQQGGQAPFVSGHQSEYDRVQSAIADLNRRLSGAVGRAGGVNNSEIDQLSSMASQYRSEMQNIEDLMAKERRMAINRGLIPA